MGSITTFADDSTDHSTPIILDPLNASAKHYESRLDSTEYMDCVSEDSDTYGSESESEYDTADEKYIEEYVAFDRILESQKSVKQESDIQESDIQESDIQESDIQESDNNLEDKLLIVDDSNSQISHYIDYNVLDGVALNSYYFVDSFDDNNTSDPLDDYNFTSKHFEAESESSAKTVITRFFDLQDCDETAMVSYAPRYVTPKRYTWRQYVTLAKRFAVFLNRSTRGNVAIHSFNCPEWFISAMGAICAGRPTPESETRFFCGIYNTNRDEQCMHIIKTGRCDVLVVESYSVLLEYYKNVLNQLSEMNILVVVIDSSDKVKVTDQVSLKGIDIVSWESLNLEDDLMNQEPYLLSEADFDVDSTCTLIFTSGTTGNPKAVQITHRNITTAIDGVVDRLKFSRGETLVSYLPLSHIAGQAIDMYCPIFICGETHFANPDAMKGTLKDTLLKVRPTIFFGVPRVWEKFKEGLAKAAEKKYSESYASYALSYFIGAVKYVEKNYNTTDNYYVQSALYPLTKVSSRVVSKIKEQLGLDRCKYFATGAAPISRDVLEYFASIGICILELYGMSETCGMITVSDPIHSVRGSCGSPVKGIEVKIGENSEILVRGGTVFKGYYNYDGPSGIDNEGYLHTGDCGRLDENGYLYITGRIKELLITAGGENIPPVLIEDEIRAICSRGGFDLQCVLIGDKRKFLTMLVFNAAEEKQIDDNMFQTIINEYNTHRAISNSQKIQKFTIVRDGLTIDNGLMTPTMKMKRSVIVERYSQYIDDMYAGTD